MAKDVVLIVKATDPKQWVTDEYRGKLDPQPPWCDCAVEYQRALPKSRSEPVTVFFRK